MISAGDGPDAAGRVVLDLGPGVGALVLLAPAELEGAEIEISPAREPERRQAAGPALGAGAARAAGPALGARAAPAARRTHSRVRKREAGGAVSYAAVYQALAAGPYVVWRDPVTPAGTVLIRGGEVTTWRWQAATRSAAR